MLQQAKSIERVIYYKKEASSEECEIHRVVCSKPSHGVYWFTAFTFYTLGKWPHNHSQNGPCCKAYRLNMYVLYNRLCEGCVHIRRRKSTSSEFPSGQRQWGEGD